MRPTSHTRHLGTPCCLLSHSETHICVLSQCGIFPSVCVSAWLLLFVSRHLWRLWLSVLLAFCLTVNICFLLFLTISVCTSVCISLCHSPFTCCLLTISVYLWLCQTACHHLTLVKKRKNLWQPLSNFLLFKDDVLFPGERFVSVLSHWYFNSETSNRYVLKHEGTR